MSDERSRIRHDQPFWNENTEEVFARMKRMDQQELEEVILFSCQRSTAPDGAAKDHSKRTLALFLAQEQLQKRISESTERLARVGIAIAIIGALIALLQLLAALGIIQPLVVGAPAHAIRPATPSALPASSAPAAAAPPRPATRQTPAYTPQPGHAGTGPSDRVGSPRAPSGADRPSPPKRAGTPPPPRPSARPGP